MKKGLIALALAAATRLMAAETNTASNAVVISPVSLLEQASLVREIAADASRDFDAEAHAKWIRLQIDALKDSAGGPSPAMTNSIRSGQPLLSTASKAPVTLTVPRPGETVNRSPTEELQQVIDRLRILKQGLETRSKPE
jgi:hypothetical protein